MGKKQTARKRPKRFLSVVPVTSREATGTTPRKLNLLAAAKQQLRYALASLEKKQREIKQLEAMIAGYERGSKT